MSDDPAHKAMLYFLEILMNSNGPLTISQLAGRFGSRSFSSEMRNACGANEAGLKKFLLKYPSLFTVTGNMVSLFDGKSQPEYPPSSDEGVSDMTSRRRSLPDVSMELEAVSFFQGKLARKEERWVSFKSLAGHLSQASADVRSVVGPQLMFRAWLLKHPHIFDVQGELVGLRDGISAMATSTIPHKAFDIEARETKMSYAPAPKTPPAQRRLPPKSPSTLRRSRSFGDRLTSANSIHQQQPRPLSGVFPDHYNVTATPPFVKKQPLRSEPVTMTASEYKAVMFLKEVIEKSGGKIRLIDVPSNYGTTIEAVRTTIGWTRADQQDFLSKNKSIFLIDDEDMVSLVKNAKLNVIITGSKPVIPPPGASNSGKGRIFHVQKLWGIVDLGQHEHVFFDKSIMKRQMDDLTKFFRSGEVLCFNAVLAHKSSRAKWRATHVWKELEQQPSGSESDISNTDMCLLSPALSLEDEINQFLPRRQDVDVTKRLNNSADVSPRSNGSSSGVAGGASNKAAVAVVAGKYKDAAPSGAGVVPIYNFHRTDSESGDAQESGSSKKSLTLVPESYQMSESSLRDITARDQYSSAINKKPANGSSSSSSSSITARNGTSSSGAAVTRTDASGKCFVEASCQTVSTGDIIATQLCND